MEYVLQTKNLSKRYGKRLVLNKVNINIERGDIYGFVGENGSGKTTVIRLISGLIFADGGDFELFGVKSNSSEILNARKKIGAIVESPSIYKNMSASDNLRMQSKILGCNDDGKILQVLRDVGLEYLYTDKKHAGDFSLGMRQRLGIAMALLGDPEFLILDEPMNGLDPTGIVEIRELIQRLNREKGITFLISSHILTELSLVANKYGIISKGRIIKEITTEQLSNECRKSITVRTDSDRVGDVLSILSLANDYEVDNAEVRIYGEVDLNSLFKAIIDSGISILGIVTRDASIENYYLSLTRGGFEND